MCNDFAQSRTLEARIEQRIAPSLERHGYALCPNLLPDRLVQRLAGDCHALHQAGSLTPARVGRGGDSRQEHAVRGDATAWIEADTPVRSEFLARLDALRVQVNQTLLLGLHDLECHYAVYPAGAFYARHRDRFRDDDLRVLSFTCYLNFDWSAEHGGALRLHLQEGSVDVLPELGVCTLFLSGEIEHEVLPATRPRYSIAGWFRRRAVK